MGFKQPTEFERLELLCLGPAGIEVQEKRGQRAFNETTHLPFQGSEHPEAKASPIQWGPMLDDPDGLFREATLPPGWTKKASDHSMWSHLNDHKGCRRAAIFYKAAFYDREAFIRFLERYYVTRRHHDDGEGVTCYVYDRGQGDEEVALYADTPILPNREADARAYYEATEAAYTKAQAWLEERFPGHKDPNAYWDPPPTG